MLIFTSILFSLLNVLFSLTSTDYLLRIIQSFILRIRPQWIIPIVNSEDSPIEGWWYYYVDDFLLLIEHNELKVVLLNWFTMIILSLYMFMWMGSLALIYSCFLNEMKTTYQYCITRSPFPIEKLVKFFREFQALISITALLYLYKLDISSVINVQNAASITVELNVFNNVSQFAFYSASFGFLLLLCWDIWYLPFNQSKRSWLESLFIDLYLVYIMCLMLDNISQLYYDSYNLELISEIYISRYHLILYQVLVVIICGCIQSYINNNYDKSKQDLSKIPWYNSLMRIKQLISLSHSMLVMQTVTIIHMLSLPNEIITVIANSNY